MKDFLKEIYRFVTLRVVFPHEYRRHSNKEIKKEKVVFIESQLPYLSGSMEVLYKELEDEGWKLSVHYLQESFVSKKVFFQRTFRCLKDIGDAEFIILCDANRVISCIPKRSETMVLQLWHGCGAFKKFGMSTADRLFGGSRKNYKDYPYYGNLNYVTVSSPEVVWAYEEAMDLDPNQHQVIPIGVSRTDVFFQKEFRENAGKKLESLVPEMKGKKVILYAPTFRKNVSEAEAPDQMDLVKMKRALAQEYILLIKHHPVVRNRPEISKEAKGFAFDISDQIGIEELLCIAEICISDYSSLVFEYSLFEKPMIFFAYDLEDYHDWRGFYYNYEELTPGPVFKTTEEIIRYIKQIEQEFCPEQIRKFKETFMGSCDGSSTDRIVTLMKKWRDDNGKE